MKQFNPTALKRYFSQVADFIDRHHVTIMVVVVLLILIGVVANVNSILSQPADEAYRQEATSKTLQTSFDQDTIKKINQLRDRQEAGNMNLPEGRINPFVE